MSLFVFRLFCLGLLLASGIAVVLIGSNQYDINLDLSSWLTPPVLDMIRNFLDISLVKSYGIYTSLTLFILFMLVFMKSLKTRPEYNFKADEVTDNLPADIDDELNDNKASSLPDRFSDTYEASSVSELIAETNSNAVLGTDGNIYDGNATFSGTETYSYIDTRSQSDFGDGLEDENVELTQTLVSTTNIPETGLSHLSDTELKSKTLDFTDELRCDEISLIITRLNRVCPPFSLPRRNCNQRIIGPRMFGITAFHILPHIVI